VQGPATPATWHIRVNLEEAATLCGAVSARVAVLPVGLPWWEAVAREGWHVCTACRVQRPQVAEASTAKSRVTVRVLEGQGLAVTVRGEHGKWLLRELRKLATPRPAPPGPRHQTVVLPDNAITRRDVRALVLRVLHLELPLPA
jgi:hypothetical protein